MYLLLITKKISIWVAIFWVSINCCFSDDDSFKKALAYTYLNNPDILIGRSSLESTNETLVQARANLYPTASLSASSQRSYTSANNHFDTESDANTVRFSGEYKLFSSGGVISGIKASEEGIRAARYNFKFQEQQILLAAIKAYLDVIRDRKLVEISDKNLKVISEQVLATRNRFALGSATRTDLAEREAANEAAKADSSMRAGTLAASEQIYQTIIGIEPDKVLSEPSILLELPKNMESAKKQGMADHPLILGSMANLFQNQERLSQLQATRGLSLTVSGAIQNSDSISSKGNSGNIGITATIPIFSGGSLVSQQRQRDLEIDNAQIRLEKQKREVEQNIEINWKNLEVARATVGARLLQVEASGLAYDGIKREYDLGARSNLELNLAEQNLIKARSDLTMAERDVSYAIYSLFGSMGKLDINLLGLEVSQYDPELSGPKLSPLDLKKLNGAENRSSLREILKNLGNLLN